MIRPLFPLALAALAACAPLPEALTGARPDSVSLSAKSLRVAFTDGSICRAALTPVDSGVLTGVLERCAQPLRYEITIERQNWLEPALGELVAPYAHIVLRDDAGRAWHWRTPEAMNRLGRERDAG